MKARVFADARASIHTPLNDPRRRTLVSFTELPTSAQSIVQFEAQRLMKEFQKAGDDIAIRTDKIAVDCHPFLSYVIPGPGKLSGEIEVMAPGYVTDWLPPQEPETKLSAQGRVVLLSATTAYSGDVEQNSPLADRLMGFTLARRGNPGRGRIVVFRQ